jgi:hypothetical protein
VRERGAAVVKARVGSVGWGERGEMLGARGAGEGVGSWAGLYETMGRNGGRRSREEIPREYSRSCSR